MDADGACEQRFASTELLIVSPVWKPGATPSLPAPRCVDARLTSTAPALIGIKHDAYVSITVENDGNMPAVGLRLVVASKGPARVGPVAGECVRASGGSCELAPIAAGTQRVVSYRVNAPRSGNEAIRVEIAPAEPDPDQSSGRLDIAISIVPCTTLGSDGDDTMFGSKGTDRICALGGRDRVEAFKGDDYVDGGSSADFIDGGAGRDRLIGGGGPDVIVADDGERDTISCGWGNDVVVADRIDKVANDCEKVARPVR
jgi:hypothetical protein